MRNWSVVGSPLSVANWPPTLINQCPNCHESMPAYCFRLGKRLCVWCEWASMGKRAAYRFGDKVKLAKRHPADRHCEARISKDDFVNWYKSQPDCCAYCGLTFAELKHLKIKRRGRCYVSWDTDRVDSARPY
jgi:hypothetical protein